MKNGGLDFAISFFKRTVRLVFSGHARSSGTLFIIVLLRSTCLFEKKRKRKKKARRYLLGLKDGVMIKVLLVFF